MEISNLEYLLKMPSKPEKKFWIIFDWVKREFFDSLKEKITKIDWTGDFLNQLENIHRDIIGDWSQVESLCQNSNVDIKRLRGVIYEVLFYFSCIKSVSIFRGSWIMEVAGDPLIPGEKPPWLDIIPIYDILPKLFRIQQENRWVLKVPQIEADFLISHWDKKGVLPLAFVDVKSSLRKIDKSELIWYALGCKWFQNSILEIAYPKPDLGRYPIDLVTAHLF